MYLLASPVAQSLKNPPTIQETTCNRGIMGSIPGSGRYPREGNGNPLQYSCLGNPMDRGAWRATVHGSQALDPTQQLNYYYYVPVTRLSTVPKFYYPSYDLYIMYYSHLQMRAWSKERLLVYLSIDNKKIKSLPVSVQL